MDYQHWLHLNHPSCVTCPPVQLPVTPVQPIVPSAQSIPTEAIQPVHMPQLNWLHFKPEFTGKPDEDKEAHLLQKNNWMNIYAFPKGVKVQHFCLTLVVEARLWYKSLRPINVDWNGLQNQFRQQYSKIGNTREQLFHVWRSFHFNENTETVDSYVTCIRQVATLLGYGKPQVLEVFTNTLPTKLYWVLFHTQDLRWAVETAKKILAKENIDR